MDTADIIDDEVAYLARASGMGPDEVRAAVRDAVAQARLLSDPLADDAVLERLRARLATVGALTQRALRRDGLAELQAVMVTDVPRAVCTCVRRQTLRCSGAVGMSPQRWVRA